MIERLKRKSASVAGLPDVSTLVQKATATLVQTTAQEAKDREERERQAERRALLEQAFREPVDVLRTVVDTFNEASEVGKLTMTQSGPLSAEVKPSRSGARLLLSGEIIPDLGARPNGVYRIIGMARIEPTPSATSTEQLYRARDSFGSFNLAYRVSRVTERFGNWMLFRFEHNPLTGRTGYPRWFALDLHEFPRQLQLLNALGMYQHEKRGLDDEWYKLLLTQLL
ncbi:MAG: hypothetical protein Q7S20_12965 [Gemmatimonadaceae bacterium]|nr:hypothetical protein [Gemmatimonadaceae bacterium]